MGINESLSGLRRLARRAKPYVRALTESSYSHYCEDALLFRAFAPGRRGYYVDVGAYDPVDGSNTYKLYRRGWRGLTIEPDPGAAWAFKALRPRDRHLTMGVSAAPATLRYHQFEIGTLNTTDAERAQALAASGFKPIGVRDIACEPLSAILEAHAPGLQVDVLNVDCEGADLAVLQSLDFNRQRPTIVIVEDLERYYRPRDSAEASQIDLCLGAADYAPVAQLMYSRVFVALDWRDLNRRSGAFRVEAIQPGLLPEKT